MADQIGAPLWIYANPATKFVAGFIGSLQTNFMVVEQAAISAPNAVTLGVRPGAAHPMPPEGTSIRLQWDDGDQMLFDETGRRC